MRCLGVATSEEQRKVSTLETEKVEMVWIYAEEWQWIFWTKDIKAGASNQEEMRKPTQKIHGYSKEGRVCAISLPTMHKLMPPGYVKIYPLTKTVSCLTNINIDKLKI